MQQDAGATVNDGRPKRAHDTIVACRYPRRMQVVEVTIEPDATRRARLLGFVASAVEAGADALSDHLRIDLERGGDGLVVATSSDAAGVRALAQLSAANDGTLLEVVADPDVAPAHRADVVETAIDTFARAGGGRLTWWLERPGEADLAVAHRSSLRPTRELHEMRCELPLTEHPSIDTRSFRPGLDDESWLAVNNRAFASHGEQGGWTLQTLHSRLAEPWFDADGFRLHERDGRLAGFCWTKIHADHDPALGEIYVIAVDPDFHGRGLGRELTLAGLDAITARGVGLANLYVDDDNVAARRLYERLGFSIHRTRVAFAGTIDSSSEQS